MLDQVDSILARVRQLAATNVNDKARARQAKALLQSVQKHLSVSQDPSTSERFWTVKDTAACRLLSAALSLNGRVPNRQYWPLAAHLLQACAQLYHPAPTATAGLSPQQVAKCQLVMAQECKKHDVLTGVARALETAASHFRGPGKITKDFLAACSCARPAPPGQSMDVHQLQYITSLLRLFHAFNSMWPGQAGVLTAQEGRKAAGAAYEVAVVLVEQAAALEINSHSSEAAACAQEMVSAAAEAASLLAVQMHSKLQGVWAVSLGWRAPYKQDCSYVPDAAKATLTQQMELMTPAFTHMLLLLAGIQLQQHYSSSGHPHRQNELSQTADNTTSSSSSSAVAFIEQYHTQLLVSFGGLSEQLYNTAATAAAGHMTGLAAVLVLLAETPVLLAAHVHPHPNQYGREKPQVFGNYARDFFSCGLLGYLLPILLSIARDSLQSGDWVQAEAALRTFSVGSACWNYRFAQSLVPFATAADCQRPAQFVEEQNHIQAQLLQQLAISLQDISKAAAGVAETDGGVAGALSSSSKRLSHQVASKGQYSSEAPPATVTHTPSCVEPKQSDAHALYVLLDLLLGHALRAANWISKCRFDDTRQTAPHAASSNSTISKPDALSTEQLQLTFLAAIEQCARTLGMAAAAAGKKQSAYAAPGLLQALLAPVCTVTEPYWGDCKWIVPGFAARGPMGIQMAAAATADSILAAAAGSATTAAATPAVVPAAASMRSVAECSTFCLGPQLTAHEKQLFALLATLLKLSDHIGSWDLGKWAQDAAVAALRKHVASQQQEQQQQCSLDTGTPVAAAAVVPLAAVPWLCVVMHWTAANVSKLGQLVPADGTQTIHPKSAAAAKEILAYQGDVGLSEEVLSRELDADMKYKHFRAEILLQNGFSGLFECLESLATSHIAPAHQGQPLAASTAASKHHSAAAAVLQQKLSGLRQQFQLAKKVFEYVQAQRYGAGTVAAEPLQEPAATVASKLAVAGPAESASARWQVIRDSFIAALPRQLEAAVHELWVLLPLPLCCNNPSCSNMSRQSELQLVGGKSCVCAGCEVARYCGRECQAAHWQAHKRVCKMIRKSKAAAVAAAGAAGGEAASKDQP